MGHFFKHLNVVTKHRTLVLIYAFKVGIPFQGFKHDLSKFSLTEFKTSSKFYVGTYSPIMEERKYNSDYSVVANHHYHHNKHHYEYYVDFFKGNLLIPKIPFKYCLEYVIDMIAASKVYKKKDFTREYVINYFLDRKDNYFMHPASKEFIHYCLLTYEKKGLKGIKKKLVKNKYDEIMSKYKENVIKIEVDKSSLNY